MIIEAKELPEIKIAHAMWTHGHSMQQSESESKGFIGHYIGNKESFATYMGPSNWLHFAIPTPVLINSNKDRLRVKEATIRFKCVTKAQVQKIEVYDGEKRIACNKKALTLAPTNWHVERLALDNTPDVQWGICISVYVANIGIEQTCKIAFSSAGCDFLPPGEKVAVSFPGKVPLIPPTDRRK